MGDIESAPFVEAMRQFQFRVGYDNFALIHVSLVPDMHGEQKTKPTQTTVHSLRGLGLLPDLVIYLVSMIFPYSLHAPDCLPPTQSPTPPPCNKRKDIDVLSCQLRASVWCARRELSLSRPSPFTITRHR